MSDYEKLSYLINSSSPMIRYKTPRNGWMTIPLICINEDSAPLHKKPGGKFQLRNVRLPYDNNRHKERAYIDIHTFDPKQPNKLSIPESRFTTLTHEYGHYLSWRNKMRPAGYEEARTLFAYKILWNRMTKDDKKMVWEEEVRAWEEGIKFVKSKGFEISPAFYKEKGRALNSYRRVLIDNS